MIEITNVTWDGNATARRSLHRADERSDFGLYSHQSRPWLNTPAAWLTRLETQLGPPERSRCDSDHKNAFFTGLHCDFEGLSTGRPSRPAAPGALCRTQSAKI